MAYSKRNHLWSEGKILETLETGEVSIFCVNKQQRISRMYKLNGQLALMCEINPDVFKERGFIEIYPIGEIEIKIIKVT